MKNDLKILSLVEHQALLPIDKIAKEIGIPNHSARYALKKLKENNFITGPFAFLNVYSLGYAEYILYFSITSDRYSAKDRLLEYLSGLTFVSWILETGGIYQFAVSLSLKHPSELQDLLRKISDSFGKIISNKSVVIRTDFIHFGRKYLSEFKTPELSYSKENFNLKIDKTDTKILTTLSNQPITSFSKIANKLDIPFTTFERRRTNLEEKKAIAGYFYRVNPEKLGKENFKLLISVPGISKRLDKELTNHVRQLDEGLLLAKCIGSWDYEVIVEVESSSDLKDILNDVYERFGNDVGAIQVVPIFSYTKRGNYPVLNEKGK